MSDKAQSQAPPSQAPPSQQAQQQQQQPQPQAHEERARFALHEIGLEIADKWANSIERRPTYQLVLQKLLDPIVRHILNSIFPWIVGIAVLFLILLICTVVTCVIVLRTPRHHTSSSSSFTSLRTPDM